jgi:hypothetical protein
VFLISDRLKTILEKHHFTGWQVYQIELYDKKGKEINGYHGFSVKGVCGPHSYNNSNIIEKRVIPNGPLCRFYKGVQIGLEEWDGSDFFKATNSREPITTKKVTEILIENKITNMELINLAEVEILELFAT